MRKKFELNDDLVRSWSATLSRGTKQYVRCVKVFLDERSARDARDVTEAELRDYVTSIDGSASRTKVTSALTSFYTYLHDHKWVNDNRARGLRRRVRHRCNDLDLQATLEAAGNERGVIRSLRWADVLPIGRARVKLKCQMPKEVAQTLRERLCRHLNVIEDPDDLRQFLQSRIFPH